MTEAWDELLLTVHAGVGQPPQMRIPMDETLGPISIGSSGGWCIVAPGVLGEHGYLYFDGTDLFLQSADPQNPLLVDGQPVPDVWTPVYCPCEISLGVARLLYSNPGQTVRISQAPLGQTLPLGFVPAPRPKRPRAGPALSSPVPPPFEDPAVPLPSPSFESAPVFEAIPLPEVPTELVPEDTPEPVTGLQLPPKRGPAPKPARPFSPGAFSQKAPDPESTRLHPIEITAASRGARLKLPELNEALRSSPDHYGSAPPAPAADHYSAPPLMEGVPIAPPQPPPGMVLPGMLPLGAPPGVPVFQDAPPGGGAPLFAAPKATGGTQPLRWLKERWQESTTPQKLFLVMLPPLIGSVWIIFTDVPPPPPRAAAPRASTIATAPSASPTETPTTAASTAPTPPASSEMPAASASARLVETSRVVAPPPQQPPPPTAPATPATGKTAQREAADAVAIGDFDEAVKLYEELAKAHPEEPAYAEAARILRAKVKR